MATVTNTLTDASAAHTGDLALLGLMQLVSPALPIGAFAWSQGLESAFELGWVNNEAELREWLAGVLEDGLSRCELPLLVRLQTAWANEDAGTIANWNQWLQATRETAELSDEDARLGGALVTLLRNLELLPAERLIPAEPGYITMFAWAWLENQLAVACKALPLGHTAAQRITEHLRPKLVEAVDIAMERKDHEIGPILPGLALGSALHETQYSRLFRS